MWLHLTKTYKLYEHTHTHTHTYSVSEVTLVKDHDFVHIMDFYDGKFSLKYFKKEGKDS